MGDMGVSKLSANVFFKVLQCRHLWLYIFKLHCTWYILLHPSYNSDLNCF